MALLQEYAGTKSAVMWAGAPVAGTSAVQTITVSGSPTGGTFKLSFRGRRTTALNHNANSATVQVALEALSTIGSGGVSASGTLSGGMAITFTGRLAKLEVALITAPSGDKALTGGTNPDVAVANTTPGVTATGRGSEAGRGGFDSTNGIPYINVGSEYSPDWAKAGPHVQAVASADGAVTIPSVGSKTVLITKGSAAALTLALPTTAQNGVRISFVAMTAFAHTVTRATEGFNDLGSSGDVATFAAAKGNGFTVEAYEGDWMVLSNIGVTIA